MWLGAALLVLGVVAYAVFEVTVYIAVVLIVVGLTLAIWGVLEARRALRRSRL